MVNVLALNVVDSGVEPLAGQTKVGPVFMRESKVKWQVMGKRPCCAKKK
jgi:hypothetical protein